eukprot:4395315-Amphidinium_carterae.3
MRWLAAPAPLAGCPQHCQTGGFSGHNGRATGKGYWDGRHLVPAPPALMTSARKESGAEEGHLRFSLPRLPDPIYPKHMAGDLVAPRDDGSKGTDAISGVSQGWLISANGKRVPAPPKGLDIVLSLVGVAWAMMSLSLRVSRVAVGGGTRCGRARGFSMHWTGHIAGANGALPICWYPFRQVGRGGADDDLTHVLRNTHDLVVMHGDFCTARIREAQDEVYRGVFRQRHVLYNDTRPQIDQQLQNLRDM